MAGLLILSLRTLRPGEGSVALAGAPTRFDRRFVATLALGPILLMLGVAALQGIELRVHWGYAMWSFLGLFAVIFVVPRADAVALRRFGRAWAGVFVATGAAYAAINSVASFPYSQATPVAVQKALPKHMMGRFQKEADFPSSEIAAIVTQRWHELVGTPLAYVVGLKWIAGNVSFFSADHPLVLRDGDPARSPWIDMTALAEHGAVVLWDPSANNDDDPAGSLQRAFPGMEMQTPLLVPWHTPANLRPLRILWGIVRPAGQRLPPSVPAT